jgi:UDP-N-acetylmuramoyl-L-alanyl-D-glutamate--2,6-diaminopimelate ligase
VSPVYNVQALLQQLAAQGVQPRRLINDSRAVEAGDVFIAYLGHHADGRQYIPVAIARGAVAVLWESNGFTWDAGWQVANVGIANLRDVAGDIAHQVYGRPSESLRLIGITGTNGKTSCAHWISRALSAAGQRCAVIGTIGNGFPEALSDAVNTTPDALTLHALLADYRAAGATACAMEVSSIGLEQHRCAGAHFAVAVFTNLTRDHLDYHRSMEAYAAAKRQLFMWPSLQAAVINLDDRLGRKLATTTTAVRKIGYSVDGAPANTDYVLRAERIVNHADGQQFTLQSPDGEILITTPLLGRYNVANLLAVAGTLLAMNVPFSQLASLLDVLTPPPGRLERLGGQGEPLVVVDYAHSPDALDNALAALRQTASVRGGRLVCVFGCGGDRDRGKRPQMGEIAARRADQVVLTSDNPRSEDPATILAEIASAVPQAAVLADRAQAIAETVAAASAADVILIAGKGHEPYQEIAGVRYPFSDVAEATRALASRRETTA